MRCQIGIMQSTKSRLQITSFASEASMLNRTVRLFCVAGFVLAFGQTAFSQVPESGIQGSGTTTLERPAERMRMQIDVLAKAKNLNAAIDQLKKHRATAEKQLATLGAIGDSIKFGEAHIDENEEDEQRRMNRMMQRQMMQQRRGSRKPEKEKEKEADSKPVKLKVRLTADWPLTAKESLGLLVETKKLQDAIKAADLAGAKEALQPTPEEAELEEESEDMSFSYSSNQGPKPGEPTFVYVVNIPMEERDKALAEAVREAKEEATTLAKAAGIELGALKSISTNRDSDVTDDEDQDAMRQMYRYGYRQFRQGAMNRSNKTQEAVGINPGAVKFRVFATVSFNIK
jgi:uncharacterized protein YggE